MRLRKKKWVKPYLENNKEYLIDKYQVNNKYSILEIGMGMGDFITNTASKDLESMYIGLEKDETCVARAISKAKELNLENLKILHYNADCLNEIIEENSIDLIYLHFSDPWPKKGHHKRRLTYNSYLQKYKKILKKDGIIIFKTDNFDLYNDSLVYFQEEEFVLLEKDEDFRNNGKNSNIFMTGYEQKFSSMNKPIYYLQYKKNN